MDTKRTYIDISEAYALNQNIDKTEPFSLLRLIKPKQVAEILKRELPATVAVVLRHLDNWNTIDILRYIDTDLKLEIQVRENVLKEVSASFIKDISDMLDSKIISFNQSKSNNNNFERLVLIFDKMGDKGKDALGLIELYDEELAGEIESKMSAL